MVELARRGGRGKIVPFTANSPHSLGILKALGLPDSTTNFKIIYEHGSLVKVSCEFFLTEDMLEKIRSSLKDEDDSSSNIKRRKRMIDKK